VSLSRKEQEFLIMLLEKPYTREDQKMYKSNAFYRMIRHLKENGLISIAIVKNKDKFVREYRLTAYGNLIARPLAGLKESPEKYKKYSIHG